METLRLGTFFWLQAAVAGKTKKRKNERTGEKKRNVTKSKESKELREGSQTNGNYGLRRAEGWEDMPSMSSEVGEI